MEELTNIEEELNNLLDDDTKEIIRDLNKKIFKTDVKNFKLDISSIIRYPIASFDLTKITRSEFHKLNSLIENQKQCIELMKTLTNHGKKLHNNLLSSLNCQNGVGKNLCNNPTSVLTDNRNTLYTNLQYLFARIEKTINGLGNNFSIRLEDIQLKKDQLVNLYCKLENHNLHYTQKMHHCIRKKTKVCMPLEGTTMVHDKTFYDAVCKDVEEVLKSKIQHSTLLQNNFKTIAQEIFGNESGMEKENFTNALKTKIKSMEMEKCKLSSNLKCRVKELTSKGKHIIEELSQKINALQLKKIDIGIAIEERKAKISKFRERESLLLDRKKKSRQLLDHFNSEKERLTSFAEGKKLIDLSMDTCYNQSTTYSMMCLATLEEVDKKILS